MIVDEHDLDLDDDITIFEGQRFTGTSRLFHPNGVLERELHFSEGFEEGLCREWYSNGQLSCEWNARRGAVDGIEIEWNSDGTLKARFYYVQGVKVVGDEWDKSGNLVQHYELAPQSDMYEYAESLLLKRGIPSIEVFLKSLKDE